MPGFPGASLGLSFALITGAWGCTSPEAQPFPQDISRCEPHEAEIGGTCFAGTVATDLSGCFDGDADDPRLRIVGDLAKLTLRIQSRWPIASDFGGAAALTLFHLAQDPAEESLRGVVATQGEDGTYLIEVPGHPPIQAELLFGADYGAGATGERIMPNFFRADSFLRGAVSEVNGGLATVSFDEPGPLVEMIGLGDRPPNPFTLGILDATEETQKQIAVFSWSAAANAGDAPLTLSAVATAQLSSVLEGFDADAPPVPVVLALGNARRGGREIVIVEQDVEAISEDGFGGLIRFAVSGDVALVGTVVLSPPVLEVRCAP